jgi:hypothetical protein
MLGTPKFDILEDICADQGCPEIIERDRRAAARKTAVKWTED